MGNKLQKPLRGPQLDIIAARAAASEMEAFRKDLRDQSDSNRRLEADFADFKSRSRQECEIRATAQKEEFIRELLPAIDNLDRALAWGASIGSRELQQGVEMTLQQLRKLLRHHGIEVQECLGQPFDPRQHEAITQRHDPARPALTILEVFERGYQHGDKVFRPAKVAVNSPPPAAPPLDS